jgi:hypothetical protein
VTDELLALAVDALERVDCQFWACEGPTLEPIPMVTCFRCSTLARLWQAQNANKGPVIDSLGNRVRQEGVDRCFCGCKYWENDRCIDCGGTEPVKENHG